MSFNTYSARFGMDRTYSVNMVGQVDERPSYSERLALFTSSGSLPNSFILAPSKIQYQKPEYPNGYNAMVEKGLQLRFCQTHNDTDRCISQDKFPSRMETQVLAWLRYELYLMIVNEKCFIPWYVGSTRERLTELIRKVGNLRQVSWVTFLIQVIFPDSSLIWITLQPRL